MRFLVFDEVRSTLAQALIDLGQYVDVIDPGDAKTETPSWRDADAIMKAARLADAIVYVVGADVPPGVSVWSLRLPGIIVTDDVPMFAGHRFAVAIEEVGPDIAARVVEIARRLDLEIARRDVALALGPTLGAWNVDPASGMVAELSRALDLFEER